MKATNAINLISETHLQSKWKLYNNVLPQVAVTIGKDITSQICDGEDGKPGTAQMADPGSKRKKIKLEDDDKKVIATQFKSRTRFIKNGMLKNYLKYELTS